MVVHPFWPGSVVALASHFFNWSIGDGGLLERFPEYRYWSFPNFPETLLVLSMIALWSGTTTVGWYCCWIVLFLVIDFVVDLGNQSEFEHRCQLLERGVTQQAQQQENWKRHPAFYVIAHALANLYVVLLECGRLYGHIVRGRVASVGFCRRFDWHCGNLPNARRNFRRREACKFLLFVLAMAGTDLLVGPPKQYRWWWFRS